MKPSERIKEMYENLLSRAGLDRNDNVDALAANQRAIIEYLDEQYEKENE